MHEATSCAGSPDASRAADWPTLVGRPFDDAGFARGALSG